MDQAQAETVVCGGAGTVATPEPAEARLASWQYCRRPCGGCPWRVDQTGQFAPEHFHAVASTAHDASTRVFRCHEAPRDRPTVCAGFILEGSTHNAGMRLLMLMGRVDLAQVHAGGHALHPGFRAMALANGVDANDPVLARCRDSDERLGPPAGDDPGARA